MTGCTPVPPVTNGLGDPHYLESATYEGNIWDSLGSEFNLPDETPSNPAVRQQINWFMSHPVYFKLMAERARPYLYYLYQQVRAKGLPAELALLPMLESSYNPFAYSRVGAAGLWQMMPGTASGFGLKVNWWYDGRRDIVASTQSALHYLDYLGRYFHGDWLLAMAAYDAGEGAVSAAIKRNEKSGKEADFWHLPLSLETRSYVPKLLALATIIKYPFEYPVDLPYVKDAPYLSVVEVGSQIDLAQAAKMAGMDLEELVSLNPGFNRWATDPDGPHQLLLPIERAAHFQEQLEHLPHEKRVTWVRYVVKKGDVLSTIAQKMKTRTALLKKVNHLKNNTVRPKQVLLIPTETRSLKKVILNFEKRHFRTLSSRIPEIKITHHVVKRGDTLGKISRRYHVTPRQICFWNALNARKPLPLGKKLILWPSHKKTHRARKGTARYRVKKGDTLWRIAHRHHVSIKKLKRENHLKDSHIKVGHILHIPGSVRHTSKSSSKKHHSKSSSKKHHSKSSSKKHSAKSSSKIHTEKSRTRTVNYRVLSGDTLEKIAKKHHVTVSDIKRWNQIEDVNRLKLRQVLVLYEKK